MKHKLSNKNTEFTNLQMNSAYETVKIQESRGVVTHGRDDYETVLTDRYQIRDTPAYANVTY